MRDVVRGKRVVIVDDSIVRGTTSRIRIKNFREAGAKEVHMRISCPPHKFPCFYGIDFPSRSELIANRFSIDEEAKYLGVDSLGYVSLDGMFEAVKFDKSKYCAACFNGQYAMKCPTMDKYCLEKGCHV